MRREISNSSNFNCNQSKFPNPNPSGPSGITINLRQAGSSNCITYFSKKEKRPLKKGTVQSRLVKDKFELTAEHIRLTDFCSKYHIPAPQTPIRHMLRPASPDEAGLFYALEPEEDEKLGAVGHVCIDFGRGGDEFRHSWWPRGPEELNTPEFREELGKVVDDLRKPIRLL